MVNSIAQHANILSSKDIGLEVKYSWREGAVTEQLNSPCGKDTFMPQRRKSSNRARLDQSITSAGQTDSRTDGLSFCIAAIAMATCFGTTAVITALPASWQPTRLQMKRAQSVMADHHHCPAPNPWPGRNPSLCSLLTPSFWLSEQRVA